MPVAKEPSRAVTHSRSWGYWHDAARPLAAAAFIVPMLVAYEGGLIVLGPQAMRNGAEAWLRRLLDGIGFGQYFLLPLLTCGLLLAWHHVRQEPWWLPSRIMQGMWLESCVLGFALLLIAQFNHSLFTLQWAAPASAAGPAQAAQQGIALTLSYLGAGVYEELLFRLMLLPALAFGLHAAGLGPRPSVLLAAFLSSLLFAAVHYQFELGWGTHVVWSNGGDVFAWSSFVFRCLAGGFFATLFLLRGFGIAAGAHAVYDILTAVL